MDLDAICKNSFLTKSVAEEFIIFCAVLPRPTDLSHGPIY